MEPPTYLLTHSMPTLPTEIFILILEALATLKHPFSFELPDDSTLHAIALTDTTLYRCSLPILYRHISITLPKLPVLLDRLFQRQQARGPPNQVALVKQIKSLHITISSSDNEFIMLRNRSWWEQGLYYLLEHTSTSLERICLHVPIREELCDLLGTMNSLKILIINPQYLCYTPMLGLQALVLAMYTDGLVGQMEKQAQISLDAITTAAALKEVIIAEPNLTDFAERHGHLVVALLHRFRRAPDVVIVPRASNLKRTSTMEDHPLAQLCRYLDMAGQADLMMYTQLRESVKFAMVPRNADDRL